jgi:glycosyltransferase involved in cell wall biosynthesis
MTQSGLISIGVPVYNGGERLRRALDSLLAQTATNFELILSDNASTDGITQQITEDYARRDPRIRLTRQAENLGAVGNFLWVLNQARGEYFLWAAHDDAWSPDYLERLSNLLDQNPKSVLATSTTIAERQMESGVVDLRISAAPNGDRWQTLKVFFGENICVWIYGMYRTEWVRQAAPELSRYPLHGGDRLWLYDLILQSTVVGDAAATFYYSDAPKKRVDRSARSRVSFLGCQIYHLMRLSWTRLPRNERIKGTWWSVCYLYRRQISRQNPIGTLSRVIKLSALAAWFGIESAIGWLARAGRTPRGSTNASA